MMKSNSPNICSVLNSNIKNFCSPQKFAHSHINRINPDKSTFLKSNLIVSNILHHLQMSSKNEGIHNNIRNNRLDKSTLNESTREVEFNTNDAYINKDMEITKDIEEKILKKEKIEKIRKLAKCRSQTSMEELKKQQQEIAKQIQQIAIMKIEMNERSRDIMGRKEDTTYLGRNLFLQGDKYFKEMKEGNPQNKIFKTQATRLLMKECANKKRKRVIMKIETNEESTFIAPSSQNSTSNQSFMKNSFEEGNNKSEMLQKQKLQEQKMIKLIKTKSFESLMKEEKRSAVRNGFIQHWAQGFSKNEDLISTKKKRKVRRSPKKNHEAEDQPSNILDYTSNYERHMALKHYKSNFNKTSDSYNLSIKC